MPLRAVVSQLAESARADTGSSPVLSLRALCVYGSERDYDVVGEGGRALPLDVRLVSVQVGQIGQRHARGAIWGRLLSTSEALGSTRE